MVAVSTSPRPATVAGVPNPGPWRVLVLDASARQALATCRALGRAGHFVGAAGYRSAELAGYSRYAARYHQLPSPKDRPEPFLEELRATVDEHGYEVVFPVDDPTLMRLAGAPPNVPTVPDLGPGWRTLTDKLGLRELCAQLGIGYPRTLAPLDAADDEEAVADLGLPVVVKAASSAVVREDGVGHSYGATVAFDRGRALESAAGLRVRGFQPLFQRYVEPSERIDLAILRRNGDSELRFACHVLRHVPLTGGIAMTLETMDPSGGSAAAAIAAVEAVCDAAGYEGLANAEVIVDETGEPYLIEVNPRLWASSWLPERLGQRVAERAVRHALGLPALPGTPYPPGRRFHYLPGEIRWVLHHERRARPLLELVRSIKLRDLFEYQDASDTATLLRYAVARVRRRLATRRRDA